MALSLVSIILFAFTSLTSATDSTEPLDLSNPIDITLEFTDTPSQDTVKWPRDLTIVLFDDVRDEHRSREKKKSEMESREKRRFSTVDDSGTNRFGKKLGEDRRNQFQKNIANQRQRDREIHTPQVNRDFNTGSNKVPAFVSSGRFEDLMLHRIQLEREDEIKREVKKAIEKREELLEEIELNKRRKQDRFRSNVDLMRRGDEELRRRVASGPPGPISSGYSLNRLGERAFARRIGNFDTSLERREEARRERLSHISGPAEKNFKRNADFIEPNDRFIRERDIEMRRKTTNWNREEEERLKEIEIRRTSEILNNDRFDENPEIAKRHYEIDKPPILILEKIPVPIPIDTNNNFGNSNNAKFRFPDFYDERGADFSDSILDRRPERPDIFPATPLDSIIQVEDGILVQSIPGIIPISPPVIPVGPSIGAKVALTSGIVAATELEKLKQAAAIADIHKLNQLQQVAVLANLNQLNHIALRNQAALNQLHGAAVLTKANAIGQLANAAVVTEQKVIGAANHDAIIKQSLLNKHIAENAVAGNQLAAAQKVDFMSLVLQIGLRNALREQLRVHLRSKVEEEAFIHNLQATREDLVRRLLMLKPYFTSPSSGGFILPAFIPNIPVGYDSASHEIGTLPKIQLLPTTTLLAPDFRLPPEIAVGLQKEIDIGFVEHVLRLPEFIFQQVIHVPKKEFILTLFPRLYRESVSHIHQNPEEHYKPNLPHVDEIKEYHHHHVHVHKNNPELEVGYTYPDEPIPDYVYTHYHGSQEDTHYQPYAHKEVHIVRHPEESSIIFPTPDQNFVVDHPRLKVPQGSTYKEKIPHKFPDGGYPLPSEGSSYVAYKLSKEAFDSSEVRFPPPHFIPSTPVPYPPRIPHSIRGVQIRPKGELGQSLVSTLPPLISTTLLDIPPQGRQDSILFPNSNERFRPLPLADEDISPILVSDFPEFRPTTFHPLISVDSNEFGPSSLQPKAIELSSNSDQQSTTPRSFNPTLIPTTATPNTNTFFAINPSTQRPIISTLKNFGFDHSEEDKSVGLLNSAEGFLSDEAFSLIPTFSTISPFVSTLSPNLATFRGFSGNIQPKAPLERGNTGHGESESELNKLPGTDRNDDDHIASFFQKKKGNATFELQSINKEENHDFKRNIMTSDSPDSVIEKIKRIQNLFGGQLQERFPDIHYQENQNVSSFSPFFPVNPHHTNGFIQPSNGISSSKREADIFNPSEQLLVHLNGHPGESKVIPGQLEHSVFAQRVPNTLVKKAPMPRRVNFSETFGTKNFPPNSPVFPFEDLSNDANSVAEVQRQNEEEDALATIIGSLPRYLREAPDCSVTDRVNRSFCIFPEGYESNLASSIVSRYDKEISEMMNVLNELPKPDIDFNEASKQIPNLNLSVRCETVEKEVKLSWSRDILGSWLIILQTEPFEQRAIVKTCGESARNKGCRPLLQPRPFMAFHPRDVAGKPYIMEFPFPVGCVYADSHSNGS